MKKKIILFSTAALCLSLGLLWQFQEAENTVDLASNSLDQHPAELAILPSDEPLSLPDVGSSLFDKVFSKTNAQGVREYDIPYPFTQVIQRLKTASGGVSPRVTIFPMGRSLQRSAAIEGMKVIPNLDPFYRFPRVVLGFDQDSVNGTDKLNMNMKGRMYIGMNEKAKLLEVISYNDEAGRYEYQIVRDYESGKTSHVTYTSRQLCLSCHQNQTPIFAQAPWSESNANPSMQEGLARVLSNHFGTTISCQDQPDAPFCYRDLSTGRAFFYLGAPIAVDQEVSYALDQSVRAGNYLPAYHKMWQRLCPDLECRRDLLRQIFLYKLTGQVGQLLSPEAIQFNQAMQTRWAKEFPNGMKIPDSAVPNRDPLIDFMNRGNADLKVISDKTKNVKDDLAQVLANTNVPAELEPLVARSPSELWSTAFVGNLPRLLVGYSSFFTNSDVKAVDDLLIAAKVDPSLYESLDSSCNVARGADPARSSLSLNCVFLNGKGLQFSGFIRATEGVSNMSGTSKLMKFIPSSSACDPTVLATPENLGKGLACPQIENAIAKVQQNADGSWRLSFQTATGISARLLDGRRLMPVNIPNVLAPGETKPMQLRFQLVRDFDPLLKALQSAFAAGRFKRYVDGKALNRLSVMSMLTTFMGVSRDDFATLSKDMMTLKKETEAPEDEIGELPLKGSERAVALLSQSCGACHYNRDNVPPAYLGGPHQVWTPRQKCQHAATCASRILYRLKMWDCPTEDAQIKKSPMPPISRMKAMNVDMDKWKQNERKNLFTHLQSVLPKKELLDILEKQGVSSSEAQAFINDLSKLSCPTAKSAMYEKLPRCDDTYSLGSELCN